MRSKKSKKRSESNSASSKPPDPPFIVFVDECLGRFKVPGALAVAGVEVKTLADVFQAGAKDADWLAALAGTEWIVFTKDKNIRRRPLEVQAFIDAGLRVFVITSTDLTGEEAGKIFVKALPKIRRFCKKNQAPFIAAVTRMSEVVMLKLRE